MKFTDAFECMSDYVADPFKYSDEEENFEEYKPTPFLFDVIYKSAFSLCLHSLHIHLDNQ